MINCGNCLYRTNGCDPDCEEFSLHKLDNSEEGKRELTSEEKLRDLIESLPEPIKEKFMKAYRIEPVFHGAIESYRFNKEVKIEIALLEMIFALIKSRDHYQNEVKRMLKNCSFKPLPIEVPERANIIK